MRIAADEQRHLASQREDALVAKMSMNHTESSSGWDGAS